MRKSYRQHLAGGIQKLLRILQSLQKIAFIYLLQRGDNEIAETMTADTRLLTQILSF